MKYIASKTIENIQEIHDLAKRVFRILDLKESNEKNTTIEITKIKKHSESGLFVISLDDIKKHTGKIGSKVMIKIRKIFIPNRNTLTFTGRYAVVNSDNHPGFLDSLEEVEGV